MKKTITMSLIFLCISSIFSAKATDVIFDFESWTSDALSRPNPINVFQDPNGVVSGWGAYDPNLQPTCQRVTPGYTSLNALSLTNRAADLTAINYGIQNIRASIKTGNDAGDPRIANTTKFAKLSLFYKYTPVGTDTALVEAKLFSADSVVVATLSKKITAASAFTELSANFVYNDYTTPVASYSISISATQTMFYGIEFLTTAETIGSKLIVDKVKLSGDVTGIKNINDKSIAKAYTNLNRDFLVVESASNSVLEIHSMTGLLISKHLVENDKAEIPLSNLKAGIYIYTIKSAEKTLYTDKFVK